MKKAYSPSQQSIYCSAGIAAEMVASIALTNMKPYRNRTEASCSPANDLKTTDTMPKKTALPKVTPSGKRDESFFQLVYDVVRKVPKGRVTSYGAIGAALGSASSARMVGWAMNGSHHIRPKVPAHRVVNRNGMLSGKVHFDPPGRMQELLEKEGIVVKQDKIENFKTLFWDPSVELGLDS
jgi:methylated-DNA-protein-cysteine methyltransferase-like protein